MLAKDMDERKTTFRLEGVLDPQRLRKLTTMTADELIAQARLDRAEHTRGREINLRRAEQQKERAAAKARGDEKEVQRLAALHAKQNKELASSEIKAMSPEAGEEGATKENDPRWKSLPPLSFALQRCHCHCRSAISCASSASRIDARSMPSVAIRTPRILLR
jgi:hypothetical protein